MEEQKVEVFFAETKPHRDEAKENELNHYETGGRGLVGGKQSRRRIRGPWH